jgi:hypothetical protein
MTDSVVIREAPKCQSMVNSRLAFKLIINAAPRESWEKSYRDDDDNRQRLCCSTKNNNSTLLLCLLYVE